MPHQQDDMPTSISTHRLLVVDDEADICEFVRFVAESLGFQVTTISDPESFESTYSDTLDIIILDLAMPRVDGIELIRFLGNTGTRASLILMSGFDSGVLHAAKELASSRGIHVLGSMKKPIAIDDLEELLQKAGGPRATQADAILCQSPTADELHHAIRNGEVTAHYQPRVDMRDKRLVAVEALARWRHPTRGNIPPGLFIPLAEKCGLIDELTTLMMNTAIEQCGHWRQQGLELQVSVNVSVLSLTNLDLPDELQVKLDLNGLPPSSLIIEITESEIMEDFAQSLDILTRIRMKGIHLSIDDFGTGHSSIQKLHKGPFNELKIDQSFVQNIEFDRNSRVITETSVDFAKKMDMTVVAEGIDTYTVWSRIQAMDCDQGQGYFIAKAMPGDEIPGWLNEWNQRRTD